MIKIKISSLFLQEEMTTKIPNKSNKSLLMMIINIYNLKMITKAIWNSLRLVIRLMMIIGIMNKILLLVLLPDYSMITNQVFQV